MRGVGWGVGGGYEHDPPLSVCLFVITEKKQVGASEHTNESTGIDFLSKKSYGNNSSFFLSHQSLLD